ncbi:SHOCT domain-containing protein [Haloarchaeobius sp. HME9146]|uniref:SHOCT domain-containing protein n=1 Tax=Haloarchaeobius sp. HME9146 TaxID=2978732 RepID=UPI0021C05379|nr:SHOCT domain-containing protein [Haloarchaeobius sp. HME9146]MCT9097269.1 SHOCT domain-containing protein [Haloarchaeobius sp. HME9146]
MSDDRPDEVDFDPTHDDADLFDKLPALIVFGTLAAVIVLGMMGFGSYAGLFAALGWIVVLPLSAILKDELRQLFGGGRDRNRVSQSASDSRSNDALEELKRRYAAGELSDEEFEARTEKLLENESLDDVRARVDSTAERETARDSEFER